MSAGGSANWGNQCGGAQGNQCGAPSELTIGCIQHNQTCVNCYRAEGEEQFVGSPESPICSIPVLLESVGFLKEAGLQAFDLIFSVNDRSISTPAKLLACLKKMANKRRSGKPYRFTIVYKRPGDPAFRDAVFSNEDK